MMDAEAFHLAALDFGPDSVDGWLARLAAAELGIEHRSLLDPEHRTVELEGTAVTLSPLEYGVLDVLHRAHGHAVTRVELLDQVWGREHVCASNVVDVVVSLAPCGRLVDPTGRVEELLAP